MTKKIYLFRHGETDWNTSRNIKYSKEAYDPDITEKGLEQAEKNAFKLKDKKIQHIYSSNFKRAKKTAQFLANMLNIEIEILNDLCEWYIYSDEVIGLTKEEIAERIGKDNLSICKNEKDALMDWTPLGNETKREARERISKTIKEICDCTLFDIIAISSHGGVIREFLRYCDFEDDSKLKNCEVVEIDYDNGNFNIIGRLKNDE